MAAPRVLVLGLTPETIGLGWPAGTRLTAIDHSPAMIERLWPAARAPAGAQVTLGDWCAMPFRDDSFDLVAGDGCFALLVRPEGYERTLAEIHRLLSADSRFAIRLFTRPEARETVDEIGHALPDIPNVSALKLRLWAAVHGNTGRGVRVHDVWEAWNTLRERVPVNRPGFTPLEISGIESYRGQETRYELPTLAEFRADAARWFTEQACIPGTGPLGDRCPTLVFRRTDSS